MNLSMNFLSSNSTQGMKIVSNLDIMHILHLAPHQFHDSNGLWVLLRLEKNTIHAHSL